MSLHTEANLETEICQHLAAHGWLYADGEAAGYDRARALFPADVLAWVQATQPKAWEILAKNHGAQAGEVLLARLRDQLDVRGTLEVLRQGIEFLGLKQPLKLAEFKPALAINADILARYAANRLRVVRQVRYSLHNENSLDLVLFLNGLPVATVELKTDFTQSIGDARGLSVFAERRDAEAKALKLPHLKNRKICRVSLSAGAGRLQQTFQPSHHTWWPLAAFDILAHCGVETA